MSRAAAGKGAKRGAKAKGAESTRQPSCANQPPPPLPATSEVLLEEPADRRKEAERLYRLVVGGEMDSGEACRRLHMLQVMHNMHGSEIYKTVQEMERRLIDAGLLPKRVRYTHE